MSYFVGGALVVGAVGSYMAADEASDATKKGIKASTEITNRARNDAIALFSNAARRKGIGLDQALNFYKTNALKRMQPFVQGNQSAQNVIGQGAMQANNAILGLPVDMSFVNQAQPNVDYSGIQAATLPQLGTGIAETVNSPQTQVPTQTLTDRLGGSGIVFDARAGGLNVRS